MERLGDIVARVLAGVRDTMDERKAGGSEGPRQLAGDRGGGEAHRLARGDAHPRISSRRMAKKATGLDATISMKR